MWCDCIVNKLEHGQSYARADIIDILEKERSGLSRSSYILAASNLVRSGLLQHKGRNRYCLPSDGKKKTYIPPYSLEAKMIRYQISTQAPLAEFTIFESFLLNQFFPHHIIRNTIFVQAKREASIFVFDYLREYTEKLVLFRPSADDYTRYWKPGAIIVKDWASEAPLNPDNPHDITIEKMLVDIFCDKTIQMVYNRADYPAIVRAAYERFSVDTPKLLRYAKKRHCEAEITAYITERYRPRAFSAPTRHPGID